MLYSACVVLPSQSPWYDIRGWLGVKSQLSIYLVLPSQSPWYDLRSWLAIIIINLSSLFHNLFVFSYPVCHFIILSWYKIRIFTLYTVYIIIRFGIVPMTRAGCKNKSIGMRKGGRGWGGGRGGALGAFVQYFDRRTNRQGGTGGKNIIISLLTLFHTV